MPLHCRYTSVKRNRKWAMFLPLSANNLDVHVVMCVWLCLMIMFVLILISPLLNEIIVWCFEEKSTRQWACYRSWFGIRCGAEWGWGHSTKEAVITLQRASTCSSWKSITQKQTDHFELSLCWWYVKCHSIHMYRRIWPESGVIV